MNNLAYAAQAVSKGFHIFPVEPGEKTPHRIRPDAPYTIRWSEVATNDIGKVVEWWQYSPEANIGIAAKPSGLIVVDCDMPKKEYQLKDTPWEYMHERLGPLVDGADVLREMCTRFGDDYSRLERTYRVCTASMGLHLYFWWPEGIQASQASPVPGLLDIRCNGGEKGGYVLGAGSSTAKGFYLPENDLPIADAPAWLIEMCREKPRPVKEKPLFSSGARTGYQGLIDSVKYAQEGNRSNCLYWAARAMYEDGVEEDKAVELLADAASEAGLTVREAEQTVRSGYRGQARKAGR